MRKLLAELGRERDGGDKARVEVDKCKALEDYAHVDGEEEIIGKRKV
jgi:hypothetical protein